MTFYGCYLHVTVWFHFLLFTFTHTAVAVHTWFGPTQRCSTDYAPLPTVTRTVTVRVLLPTHTHYRLPHLPRHALRYYARCVYTLPFPLYLPAPLPLHIYRFYTYTYGCRCAAHVWFVPVLISHVGYPHAFDTHLTRICHTVAVTRTPHVADHLRICDTPGLPRCYVTVVATPRVYSPRCAVDTRLLHVP